MGFLDVTVLVLHICFLPEKQDAQVLNENVYRASSGPSCKTFRGPYDGRFWGGSLDVGNTCFISEIQLKNILHLL